MFHSHCDPVIYFSSWMSDTICREYLTHFSEHQWLLVGKYTLLLGLAYFQKLGLNIFHMCLKTTENSLDLFAQKNKETIVEDLEKKTNTLKTFFCEAHVFQKCEEIPKIILNKKNLQCSTIHFEQDNKYVYQRDVNSDCQVKLTSYQMYTIFRRFFLQFPEKTWSHFIKIFFVFGIHYISVINIKLHTLSLTILRDLLKDYGVVLERKGRCSTINEQDDYRCITRKSQGMLQRSCRGVQPPKIFQRMLIKSKEPELNHEELVFPFQFISSVFLEKATSSTSVVPDWWNDEECMSFEKRKIRPFLNRFTTAKEHQIVHFIKEQQRSSICEKSKTNNSAVLTHCKKHCTMKKKKNTDFYMTTKENKNFNRSPKAAFFLSQSLHVYSLDPYLTKNWNAKGKSSTEAHSKQLYNFKKSFNQSVRNVNNNSSSLLKNEKTMIGNKHMCNLKRNSLYNYKPASRDRTTKTVINHLPKMWEEVVPQNFKEDSKSEKVLEIRKPCFVAMFGERTFSQVHGTQARHTLKAVSEKTFLKSGLTTRPNNLKGSTGVQHVAISNRQERVLNLENTLTQKTRLHEKKAPRGIRPQFENRPCFHRVSYNARHSATLPLHLLCHSYQR